MNPTWPKRSQRQLWALLEAMLRGERLSTIAALQYGCGSCSQRVNDLRRLGWPVEAESVKNSNGGWHFEYYMTDQQLIGCGVEPLRPVWLKSQAWNDRLDRIMQNGPETGAESRHGLVCKP